MLLSLSYKIREKEEQAAEKSGDFDELPLVSDELGGMGKNYR